MRIHRVYCKLVSGPNDEFSLDESQSQHLVRALRLKETTIIEIFDGHGYFAKCKIMSISKTNCDVVRIEELKKSATFNQILTAVIPIIKGNNFNFMLQKLSEIGVNKFVIYKPQLIDQSVAKKNITKILDKSKEVVINVCKQCGNNFLPSLAFENSLKDAISSFKSSEIIYAFDTDAEEYFNQDELKNDHISIITGPESGFSEDEINELNNKKINFRYLGDNVLRSETAPIFVAALIKNYFGRIKK